MYIDTRVRTHDACTYVQGDLTIDHCALVLRVTHIKFYAAAV